MSLAALKLEDQDDAYLAHGTAWTRGPLKCVLMDDSRFDRRLMRSVAKDSRFPIDFIETSNISETRAAMDSGLADLVMLDYRVPDGDGIEFAAELSKHDVHGSIPIIVVTGEGSEDAAMRAIRSGAADYLQKDGLSSIIFDQAVENALSRSRPRMDNKAMISNLEAENAQLRRNALRNMRLLKGQALPLMSLAWGAVQAQPIPTGSASDQEQERADTARKLAKITRNVTGLIDDTVITAATFRANDVPEPVDLTSVVAELAADMDSEIGNSRADIRVAPLPVIKGARAQFIMLFEELLLTAIRSCPLGRTPEIRIGAAQDPKGNPIIWLTENGIPLSARKQTLSHRSSGLDGMGEQQGRDVHAWSLCQRIAEKNGGMMKIMNDEGGLCRVMIRFPQAALQD